MPTAEETFTCTHCEEAFENPPAFADHDREYCEDCADHLTFGCACCAETFLDDQRNSTRDGGVCESCYENYYECSWCSEHVHGDDTTCVGYQGEETVCDSCFSEDGFICQRCEYSFMGDHAYINDGATCSDCCEGVVGALIVNVARCDQGQHCNCEDTMVDILDNIYSYTSRTEFHCIECDRTLSIGRCGNDAHTIARFLEDEDDDIELHCNSCSGNTSSYQVMSYSYKPVPKFKLTARDSLSPNPLCFGTEVELEMSDDCAPIHSALRSLGEGDKDHRLFYCKRDASIENGFEVVSQPFTIGWMRENREAFEPMFNLASEMRGFDSKNCGMHVHMSLAAFSRAQIFKFMRFFAINREYIGRLSRRPLSMLERWAKIENESRAGAASKVLNGPILSRNRGALTPTSSTIECRIFRSTLSPTAYFGNIEFLQALFDYTATCGISDRALSADSFIKYTKDRSSAYKNFITLSKTTRPAFEDTVDWGSF